MPQGFEDLAEAELHKAPRLLEPAISEALKSWWLAPASRQARTPNFDIASTCTISGSPGLLLVEAKAHDEELNGEAAGRRLTPTSSENRRASHEKIGTAISGACDGLARETRLSWSIGRDVCYQMSNRMAWAWKLTELGVSVVLVYLGFLNASEMQDKGRPFADHEDWDRVVKTHSARLFASDIWGKEWPCNGRSFVPLIRSRECPLRS